MSSWWATAESGCHLREYRIRHLDSNGLRRAGTREASSIVLFEPYSAGFTDASPLNQQGQSLRRNALFSVSYLNDLIRIVRHGQAVGLNIAINGGSGGFRHSPILQETSGSWPKAARRGALEHDMDDGAQKVNAEYKKRTGEFLFEYAGVWSHRPS